MLEVFDDGAGFEVEQVAAGSGILGMRERAAALGAEFELTTAPSEGTLIRVVVPTTLPRAWHYDAD